MSFKLGCLQDLSSLKVVSVLLYGAEDCFSKHYRDLQAPGCRHTSTIILMDPQETFGNILCEKKVFTEVYFYLMRIVEP